MTTSVTFTVGDLLVGCRPGVMQSVGIMQVIPLLNDNTDEERFARPDEAIVGTSNYGSVVVQNPSTRLMIVPLNAAYMTKKGAQDHAITTTGALAGATTRGSRTTASRETFNNSLCIESTQGGTMPADNYRLSVLPAALRTNVARLASRSTSYNAAWGDIERFNSEMGSGSRGHLRDFFDRFEKELDEFIAQFEPVPGQVGAIILIGGEIVGIERAPSQHYWLGVWEALIRDCYGSRAMQAAKRGVREAPDSRVRVRDVSDARDLLRAVAEVELAEAESVGQFVRAISQERLESEKPYRSHVHGSLDVRIVKNARITGQAIFENQATVYASLVNAGT